DRVEHRVGDGELLLVVVGDLVALDVVGGQGDRAGTLVGGAVQAVERVGRGGAVGGEGVGVVAEAVDAVVEHVSRRQARKIGAVAEDQAHDLADRVQAAAFADGGNVRDGGPSILRRQGSAGQVLEGNWDRGSATARCNAGRTGVDQGLVAVRLER